MCRGGGTDPEARCFHKFLDNYVQDTESSFLCSPEPSSFSVKVSAGDHRARSGSGSGVRTARVSYSCQGQTVLGYRS